MGNFLFDKIQIQKPKLNAFDLSNVNRFSCEFGQLIPVACKEVLPGDKFKIMNSALVRLAPMATPAMARIDVDIRWFFVPNRLIWDKWEEFITGGTDGNSELVSAPMMPINSTTIADTSDFGAGSLWDYMNLPPLPAVLPEESNNAVSPFPFKAYAKIWNDWYRDEMLDDEIDFHISDVSDSDVADGFADYSNILYRRFAKDYFTTARPQAQLGSPVLIPNNIDLSQARVNLYSTRDEDAPNYRTVTYPFHSSQTLDIDYTPLVALNKPYPNSFLYGFLNAKIVQDPVEKDVDISKGNDSLKLNLEHIVGKITGQDVSTTTINDLRRAYQLQKWAEKSSLAGNRYIENILAHFGVLSSDARLQRSEYLGGTSSPVVISEIEQNTPGSVGSTPLGTLAGRGTSVTTPKTITFRSEEHGLLIGLLSITPKVGYNQGVPRMFTRRDKFDYAWPEFANIGEQAVYTSELFYKFDSSSTDMYETFGYQSRYAEYKSSLDETHGEFRTSESLSSWVQNRNFTNKPVLNTEFIGIENSVANLNNIFAVTSGVNHFYCQVLNDIKALRPLSKYGIPGLL